MHPSANPVETFMKPLGKAMKIAHNGSTSQQTALAQLLDNYRDTPHPATGVTPAAMLFRDAPNSVFPGVTVSAEQIAAARERDREAKVQRQMEVNDSKYKKKSDVKEGDWVLIRNFSKTSKFDPIFQTEPCKVTEISDGWVVVEREGIRYRRHRDDIKVVPDYQLISHPAPMQAEQHMQWAFTNGYDEEDAAFYIPLQHATASPQQGDVSGQVTTRQSTRLQQQQGSPASVGPLGHQEENSAQGGSSAQATQGDAQQGSHQHVHPQGVAVENAGATPVDGFEWRRGTQQANGLAEAEGSPPSHHGGGRGQGTQQADRLAKHCAQQPSPHVDGVGWRHGVQQANEVAEGTPQLSLPSHHGGGRGRVPSREEEEDDPACAEFSAGKRHNSEILDIPSRL